MPGDPAVAIRLALAHAGAGRLDVATRLLDRATQRWAVAATTAASGKLASAAEATLLAGAQQGSAGTDVGALLTRRLWRTPLPDVASVIVVRAAIGDDPLQVRVASDAREGKRDEHPADLDAAAIGISAIRIERGGGSTRIALRRPQAVQPSQPIAATVTALVLAEDRSVAKLCISRRRGQRGRRRRAAVERSVAAMTNETPISAPQAEAPGETRQPPSIHHLRTPRRRLIARCPWSHHHRSPCSPCHASAPSGPPCCRTSACNPLLGVRRRHGSSS